MWWTMYIKTHQLLYTTNSLAHKHDYPIVFEQPFCYNQCALHEFITLFNTNTFELHYTLSLSNTSSWILEQPFLTINVLCMNLLHCSTQIHLSLTTHCLWARKVCWSSNNFLYNQCALHASITLFNTNTCLVHVRN